MTRLNISGLSILILLILATRTAPKIPSLLDAKVKRTIPPDTTELGSQLIQKQQRGRLSNFMEATSRASLVFVDAGAQIAHTTAIWFLH